MRKNKEDKKNKNSMVDIGKESTNSAKGIFSTIANGFKDMITILKSGRKPNQKISTGGIILIVISVIIMLFFAIDTIINF